MVDIVNQAVIQEDGAWKDKSIDKLEIFSEAHKKDFGKYTVSQPHPLYGTDPNIINEFGHTIYPKMVYPHGKHSTGVIVNDAEEEKSIMGGEVEKPKLPENNGWS